VRSNPYIITFKGTADHAGDVYYTDITLMICVYGDTSSPCLTVTSKNEILSDKISVNIYPNPFNDKFTISGAGKENNSLVIYDLTGRIVKNILLFSSTNEIDVSDISDGFFLFEIRDSKAVLAKGKLIKESH
jgi:hypothetical protein